MQGTISEANISFDAPQAFYLPGETVTGLVLLVLPKTIDARFLKLSWEGKTFVGWLSSPDTPCTNYYYQDFKYLWCNEDGKDEMPAGSYTFPFSFDLPKDLPPSFDGEHGSIKHGIHLELNRPQSANESVYKEFKVTKKAMVDEGMPVKYNNDMMLSWFMTELGQVEVDINLRSKILSPGHPITVNLTLKNYNIPATFKKFQLRLIQRSHFHSRPQHTFCKVACNEFCPLTENRQKNVSNIVQEKQYIADTLKGTQEEFSVPFFIPEFIPPSFTSPSITVDYELQLIVMPDGWFIRPARFYVNVVIGGHKVESEKAREAGAEAREQEWDLGFVSSSMDAPPPYSP